jgi:hypothetical protein
MNILLQQLRGMTVAEVMETHTWPPTAPYKLPEGGGE